ncbi:MAG TPA: ATP-binding cassette domain-containing protein [Aggregatilineaceae bacterium]|nr:ATP-binding cassette domain-containing protein [Aggregatilineaceae bacterium]
MIEAIHLAKSFKKFEAVRDVTFTAREGEVFGLLGPNGAGKTTTLRMLSTVIQPSSGTARINGYDIHTHKDLVRSNLGILVESAGLYAHSTTREHLRYVGNLHGLDGAGLEQQINELIEALDMRDFADRRAQGFSRGMIRKVVMAMALIHNPPNVILDEPTQGLDVVSTRAVREIIRRFQSQGRCVLMSTHHMDEVERLCDRVAVVHRGTILEEGTPQELTEKYQVDSLETAFIEIIGAKALLEEAEREALEKRRGKRQ